MHGLKALTAGSLCHAGGHPGLARLLIAPVPPNDLHLLLLILLTAARSRAPAWSHSFDVLTFMHALSPGGSAMVVSGPGLFPPLLRACLGSPCASCSGCALGVALPSEWCSTLVPVLSLHFLALEVLHLAGG